jgi:hypothetical protein
MTALRRVDMWLPWLAGALLAAGVITFLVGRFGGNTAGAKETFGSQDAVKPQVVKQVPLEPAARETAGKFILTAVARKNLDQAWKLATPNIKGGLSFKEWMTGNIPVPTLGVPIDKAAITKIIYSHKREAELNIVLLPKPNKLRVKSTLFVMDLKKVGTGDKAHWLVDYCQVQQGIPVPRPT